MLGRLDAIGYCRKSFDGITAVDYQEIKCWCDLTGESLTAWEVDTLRLLSSIYAIETMKSTKEDYKCPIEFEDRAEKNKRLDDMFRVM